MTRRKRAGGLLRSVDRRLLGRIIGIGLGAFLVGYLLTAAIMWAGAAPRTVVSVPDVRTMSLAEARSRMDEADLEMVVGDSLPNPLVPAGAVLAQSPLPGREVVIGSAVRVILSTGRERRAVPQVEALTRDQAVNLLQAAGFQVQVREVPDPRLSGRVVGTEPAAGTVVRVPAPVHLLVSSGPPLVAVPGLVGLPEADLAGALQAAGLELGEVRREFQLGHDQGEVLTQSPAPGDSVYAGSKVDVVVATHELPGIEAGDIR